MSNIMIVLDGLQDIAYEELVGKTPYDFGKCDSFKTIEAACITGSLATTPPGFEPDTQTCILTMLGVESKDIPTGRSYIEAAAVGVPVKAGDIVMRCNFVKVSEDGSLEDPTCMAPDNIATALRAEVAAGEGVGITPVGSYKSLQVVAGGAEYLKGMVTYPPHNYAGKAFESLLPSGNALADTLAWVSRRLLEKYAPYTVLNWAEAVPCTLPSFSSLHGGMSGGMVSATHAPMGCAVAMGMECPVIKTATGDVDTDLAAKAEATLKLADTHDFVMLHIGGPDEATHRKDALEKAGFVKKLDGELLAPILNGCKDKTRIMITCDHEAICSTGGHTSKPVSFWLFEKNGALSGDIGVLDGKKAVEIMVKV